MHKTLQLKSNLSVTELLNLSNTLNFIDPSYINLTNPHFNNFNSVNDTGLYPICKMFINEIKSLSSINNSAENLLNIFPEKAIQFEYFEFSEISNDPSLYEILSTPELKIYYPEPFIASPSFVHEDLWFMHIMHFQHWLWFFFISLIMLFFITFVNVVRWCNLRIRPRRETRGVSRSKCADLITACVPVSWASAIIITETVDATDYYDGFGTGEIIIGIRAYQ
jgi:hypothetical protein